MGQFVLVFLAALVGGAINAIAGGGSFVSFPVLLLLGIPPLQANTTNALGLWPAALSSTGAYHQELRQYRHLFLFVLVCVSLIGSAFGALLLLHTPTSIFQILFPYLLLGATVAFTIGNLFSIHISQVLERDSLSSRRTLVILLFAQFMIAIYGGYFGGGIGILMLAVMSFLQMGTIHALNGLKTLLVASISSIAILIFILAHEIFWTQALLMMVGGSIGGYTGASCAKRIHPRWIQDFVSGIGFSMTISAFYPGRISLLFLIGMIGPFSLFTEFLSQCRELHHN